MSEATLTDGHTNMTAQDELDQLEAERDQLLSMIAHHDGPFYRAPSWFFLITHFAGTREATAGEPEARQRLADCEARIMKLKGGRS
jgi:hypothetical protein